MNQSIHTTTNHTIGKITYCIISESSEKARETLDKKIKKLIQKDLQETSLNRHFSTFQ